MSAQILPGMSFTTCIKRLTFGAEGVGTAPDGRTTFVPRTLPGEEVRVEVTSVHKRFMRANPVQLIHTSPDRVEPDCPYYGRCGGCQLRHAKYTAGCSFKFESAFDEIQKLSRHPIEFSPKMVASPPDRVNGYRVRARLSIGSDGTPGFLAARSSEVVAIERCSAMRKPLSDVIGRMRGLLPAMNGYSLLIECDEDGLVYATFEPQAHVAVNLRMEIAAIDWSGVGLSSIGVRIPSGIIDLLRGDGSPPHRLSVRAGNTRVHVRPGGFRQANEYMNSLLVDFVMSQLRDKGSPGEVVSESGDPLHVWDLFCGYGNLSFPIARQGCRIHGVDIAADAIKAARKEARRARLSECRFTAASLGKRLPRELAESLVDVIVMDPPRDGARHLVPTIVRVRARRIIYVSCHPATFARDLRVLIGAGYRLASLALFDMFPQTAHLEVAAVLTE